MAEGPRNARAVYLVTYSQADLTVVPTKERFSDIVDDAFSKDFEVSQLDKWCCSLEKHQDGNFHYHMALKLVKQRRWLAARNYMEEKHKIKVNFSDNATSYYKAWQYCTKSDEHPLYSAGHPNFVNPPRTAAATAAKRSAATSQEEQAGPSKKKRFDALDLSNIIIENRLKNKTQLLNYANNLKKDGKNDVALFILNNIQKSVRILQTTWEMEESSNAIERKEKGRIEILEEARNGMCVDGCNGRWKAMAIETLQRNNIYVDHFTYHIRHALTTGRSKESNILIIGPANCGKTFLLKPLQKIFQCFSNPATGTFAWVGVEECEVIFLNDFRYDQRIIAWQDFLKLLEGDEVKFAAPKTHFAKDISFRGDSPIFCTSSEKFTYLKNGVVKEQETEMMESRWKTYTFHYQIKRSEMNFISPCSKCFADFVLNKHLESDSDSLSEN